MRTDCRTDALEFEGGGHRRVIADFAGGAMTSDAGALLLRHVDRSINMIDRIAKCFVDHRSPESVVHSLRTLIGQRMFGIALDYEDVSDHDDLRHDPANLEALFVDLFLKAHTKPPKRIILDLDATDDPLHGHQEGRFYHGYYDCYCYLPLYIFCGRHLIAAKLRPSNIDASAGAKDEVERIVAQIRTQWPRVRIWLRADANFACVDLMAWCEANRVDYVFGLARHARLIKRIAPELREAHVACRKSGGAERRFKDFTYRTLNSWTRRRRVIGKAGHLLKGTNPRFVVTSLKPAVVGGQVLYEQIYCARGDRKPD